MISSKILWHSVGYFILCLQNYNKKMIYASKSSNFAKLFAYMKKKQYLCSGF